MKALLIIDMQTGSFKPYSIRYNTMHTIERINSLSENFRTLGYPVIYIKHDGSKRNCFIPNTKDFEILPELVQKPSDIVVIKETNDAFYNTELQSILVRENVNELYICGCATNFCVDSTVKSALAKDFKIYIASDAHTTVSCPHIDAQTIIQYYNWLWNDLTPTKHKITVFSTANIIDNLQTL
jgi:nicotinamidase-related amidase